MKAIEFKTELKNNQIRIPDDVQSELKSSQDKPVRVIVLIEESDDVYDWAASRKDAFRQLTKEQFLKGYAESDSVYDD